MNTQLKRIWITGGGSGIGRALALRYAGQGYQVVISGRTLPRLLEVQSEGQDLAGEIIPLVFDVTAAESVPFISAQLSAKVSHLDLVILNAGTCEYLSGQLDTELFKRVMDTNFFGLLHSLNAALPLLRKAPQRPHVAAVCSMAAFTGFPRAGAYGASKAAARYLMHSLRIDYSAELDVTVVNPGFVETPMTAANDFPMPFAMGAEEAATRIATALKSRPLEYNFPRRLSFSLRLAQLFPRVWYKRMGRQRMGQEQ